MKTTIRSLVVLILMLAILSQHTTASAVSMFKFKGLGANASFDSIDNTGCIQTHVDLFTAEAIIQGSRGARAPFSSVSIFLSQYDLCTGTQLLAAEGVADLAEPDLQISPKLLGATLNTTIPMQDLLTGNTFELSVNLTWTGIGPLSRQHSSFHFGDKVCRVLSRFKGTFRGASVVGSISDGVTEFAPEPSVGGDLISSNSRDMSIGCE